MPSAANQSNTIANNQNSNNNNNQNKSNKALKTNTSLPLNSSATLVANSKSSIGAGTNNKTANKTKVGCNNNNNGHPSSNPNSASGNPSNKCKEKSANVTCNKNADGAESSSPPVAPSVAPAAAPSVAPSVAPLNPAKSCDTEDANNPMKLTFTTIEHKIRNLEKRKTKLETYRTIQANGKELSSDQCAAVAKYDAVINTLEFARNLVKQMQQFCQDAEKEKKKQARKELLAKAQAETAKIKEVLIMQNILRCFTDKNICNDFLNGENGATKIEPHELEALKKFYTDVQIHQTEGASEQDFANAAQKAAEIYSITIDGRPKPYGDITYEKMRSIFQHVKNCNYWNKVYSTCSTAAGIANKPQSVLLAAGVKSEEHASNAGGDGLLLPPASIATDLQVAQQQNVGLIETQTFERMNKDQQVMQTNMRSTAVQSNSADRSALYAQSNLKGESNITFPMNPPHAVSTASQAAIGPKHSTLPGKTPIDELLQGKQLHPTSTTTTTKSPAVAQINSNASPNPIDNNFFNQQSQNFLQQIRPLAEVIGGSNYYFLQDSELDSSDLNIVPPAAPANLLFEQKQSNANSLTAKPDAQAGVPAGVPGNVGQSHHSLAPNVPATQANILTHIQTQTFTNQSFSQRAGQGNSAGNNIPATLFRQNQTTDSLESSLFSANNPMQAMQQRTMPLPLIPNLTAAQEPSIPMLGILPQVQTTQQQQQQQQQQQKLTTNLLANKPIVDFNDEPKAVTAFPFENSLINTLAYGEQIPKELINNRKIDQCLNKTAIEMDITKANQQVFRGSKSAEAVSNWPEAHLKATNDTAGPRKNCNMDLRASGDGSTGFTANTDNRNEANPWHTEGDHSSASTSAFGRNANVRISGPSAGYQRREDRRSTTTNLNNNKNNNNRSNLSQHQHNGNAAGSNIAYNNNKNSQHHRGGGAHGGPPGGRNSNLNNNQRANTHGAAAARSIGGGRSASNINMNANNVQHNLRSSQPTTAAAAAGGSGGNLRLQSFKN